MDTIKELKVALKDKGYNQKMQDVIIQNRISKGAE